MLIGGDDFKSGQTKMKSVLVDFLVGAGIKPTSIVSYNHLGNNDGKNLSAPQTFRSKVRPRVRACHVACQELGGMHAGPGAAVTGSVASSAYSAQACCVSFLHASNWRCHMPPQAASLPCEIGDQQVQCGGRHGGQQLDTVQAGRAPRPRGRHQVRAVRGRQQARHGRVHLRDLHGRPQHHRDAQHLRG